MDVSKICIRDKENYISKVGHDIILYKIQHFPKTLIQLIMANLSKLYVVNFDKLYKMFVFLIC